MPAERGSGERLDRARGGSLRHGLLFRLLSGSILVAVCSITATAWLAVQRTSESITVQQGETLAVDTHIHDTLLGYAATHRGYSGVGETVRDLAEETGRRIVLTTEGRAVIADSAEGSPPLPSRISSVVDPLAVDVTLAAEDGDRIDPRAVGPFALTDHERMVLRAKAEEGVACLDTMYMIQTEVVTAPTGRPALDTPRGEIGESAWIDCGLDALDVPFGSEEDALRELNASVTDCGAPSGTTRFEYAIDGAAGALVIRPAFGGDSVSPPGDEARAPVDPVDPDTPVEPTPDDGRGSGADPEAGGVEPSPWEEWEGWDAPSEPTAGAPAEEVPEVFVPDTHEDVFPSEAPRSDLDPSGALSVRIPPETAACFDTARREQLDPHVAPAALLFIDDLSEGPESGLSLSREGVLRVGGMVLLVLVLTVVVSATLATRLLRPVHALTTAVRRMRAGEEPTRVEVRDSGEIGRLAEAFNEMTEHLERAEEQRRAMVSDVSHELRTPLSNLRGWLEAVQDGVVDPEPEHLEMLVGETLLLQAVIDDLQDLALADAGRLRLSPEPVAIGPLIDQVVTGHGLRAEEAGVRLIDESEDMTLVADRTRLLQALGNLVGNALRHTPESGTVTIRARRSDGEAVIEVTDTGVGIAEADLPYVFERFWRADKSRNRRTGGSGLGLAIVRGLVELHGGRVSVRSTVGKGTTFTIRLPSAGPPERGPAGER
ncbi:sensor histidine kinase [Nocardiopsis lambiniae]|uniref:histidine kinase n=1 Tax=Nocardiopsis lambiniae TaxID=3075539 RepID=A0ABU2MCQ4_9ACTN|nr:HAMP domain-containing sensor histidine kinase [Nocardiopsis sp. DSM 44743]MDT0329706.1 HAMP domain-containing sensor histidine kinase [Nocardiopsis sp. DSM 44743]